MIKEITKKDLLILFGNVIDHFDTSLYVFMAPILAPLFFPNEDALVGLIMAYSILATNIITRPIGIYIFSVIAKHKGPNQSLSLSLIGVGFTTLFISFIPYYSDIGIISPIIFILCRSIRELFASGEIAIASIYILEKKTEKMSFKSSYLFQCSTMIGIILASISATILYHYEIKDLWRVFYFIGGSAAIVGYVFRKKYFSPIYYTVPVENSVILSLKVLWSNKFNLLKIAVISGCSYITYLLPFVIMNRLMPFITNIDIQKLAINNNYMLFIDLILILFFGKMLTNFHYNNVMKYASLTLTIAIIPLFYFLPNSNENYILFVKFVIIVLGIIYMCPLNIWTKNIINNQNNYLIVGIGSALGNSIIGKLSPSIALFIFHYTNNINYVSVFFMSLFFTAYLIISLCLYKKED